VSAALSSRVVRRFAPVGASSCSLSPSAKAPWHAGHPEVFQAVSPALTRASSSAKPAIVEASIVPATSMAVQQQYD